jgi:hypothetical protein
VEYKGDGNDVDNMSGLLLTMMALDTEAPFTYLFPHKEGNVVTTLEATGLSDWMMRRIRFHPERRKERKRVQDAFLKDKTAIAWHRLIARGQKEENTRYRREWESRKDRMIKASLPFNAFRDPRWDSSLWVKLRTFQQW